MGEAKRKRDKSLREGLEAIRDEGQGVWQAAIYNREGCMELTVKSLAGDVYATTTMRAIARMIRDLVTAKPTKLCLLCENDFTERSMPAAFVLMHAMRDDPKQAVGNGVCEECYAKHGSVPALGPVVAEAYRKQMINDLRIIHPVPGSGRA